MDGRYILGVAAAIVAGVLFNVGTLVQKLALRPRKNVPLRRPCSKRSKLL